MKRPLLIFSLSLITGIIISATTGSYLAAVLLFSFLLISAMFLYSRKPGMLFLLAGVILFYSIGAFEYLYVNSTSKGKFADFLDRQVTVRGFVDSEPDIRESRVMYVIKTVEIAGDKGTEKADGKILLTTLKSSENYVYDYGKEIFISGLLVSPKGQRVPGGFDYKMYLARQGISATMFAKGYSIREGDGVYGNWLVRLGITVRARIIDVINKSLPPKQAGLLNGMLIGYREGLTKEVQDTFSDSGLTHLMAVSGMNVAFLVVPLAFLFKKMRLRIRIANPVIICILIFFVFITGFSPSVLRAVIMAIVILTGQMLKREGDVLTSLSLAASILLIYNPYSLFDIGFQLSFAATLSIILFYSKIKDFFSFKYMPGFLADVISVTLAAQICVIPITAFYFNKISLISILSNVIAVPMAGAITVLGFAMAVLGQISILFSQVIGYINNTLLTIVLFVSKTSSELPYAVLKIATPPLLLILAYYIMAAALLWKKQLGKFNIKIRYLFAVLGVIAGMNFFTGVIFPKGLEVVFIDVGEGDSSFVKTASGKTILIDGGGYNPVLNPDTNIGDTVIIPFLLDQGVTKLDLVIATHGHDDHIQGLIPVLQDFNVGSLVIPDNPGDASFKKLLDIAGTKGLAVEKCQKGDVIRLDSKTRFETLNPDKEIAFSESALNNSSLVLKLIYKDTSILFSGDMEQDIEASLVKNRDDVKADILKVAHHGSAYSTKQTFLDLVDPVAAIISVGKNNFGHPSQIVLKTLETNHVRVFRTDEDGAVILKSDGEKIKLTKTITEN